MNATVTNPNNTNTNIVTAQLLSMVSYVRNKPYRQHVQINQEI